MLSLIIFDIKLGSAIVMGKNIWFTILSFFVLLNSSFGGGKDSTASIPMIFAAYGYHMPGGDLAERFGNHSTIGAGFEYKTTRNFIWGFEFDYLFGDNLKEESILGIIETEEGYVIDISGTYADVFLDQSGFRISAKIGKIIPVSDKNKNSGIVLTLAAGLLQHKIRIVNKGNTAPQLDNEYKKGYDKLSNGFALTEFIGYKHLGKKSLYSFFAGFEFTQAWTKSRRDVDFDIMAKDDRSRLDLTFGIKIGWVFPLYGRQPEAFYYH